MPAVDEDFLETFQLFDKHGDGKVMIKDVGTLLRALGQNPSEADVKKLIATKDPNQRISLEEFLPIYQTTSKIRCKDNVDSFIEGFRQFDKDGNGYIPAAEIRYLLTTIGEKLKDLEVDRLLQGHQDSMGNVHYEEFVKAIMNG